MVPYNTNVVALPCGKFLAGRGANATSQFGEDGLIAACLDRFGSANRWCFEVGAHDGLFFSNTHCLRCAGWDAVLIESDPDLFLRLCDQRTDRVRCHQCRIDRDGLDRILTADRAPQDIDFGVIDIDGQDYWAWCGMTLFRPRLMLVEFEYGSDDMPVWIPTEGGAGQASYKAIEQLGRDKGYTALAKTTVNLLFVRDDVLAAAT